MLPAELCCDRDLLGQNLPPQKILYLHAPVTPLNSTHGTGTLLDLVPPKERLEGPGKEMEKSISEPLLDLPEEILDKITY